MTNSGNVHISDAAKVFGPVAGYIAGDVNTAYNFNYGDVQPRPVEPEMLAQAQAKLSALPLDVLPDPAPLPHGSHVPLGFSRNALFVGRGNDLRALAQAIKGDATVAIGPSVAVTGMGGLGKTQLANEFVHRYGQFFAGGVVWLNFDQADSIPGQIAACHPVVTDPQVAFKLMLAEWQSLLPRLLVFDNCEDEALLKRWRPPGNGCHVLVTSRRASWALHLGVQRLALGVLSADESEALLRKHRPDLPPHDPDLTAIADALGHLPLALHVAGSFLGLYGDDYTPGDYLHELQAMQGVAHELLEGEGISPTDHDQSVFRTIKLSYDKLTVADPVDGLALKLIARAAYFAPGVPIPRDLLRAANSAADDSKAKLRVGKAMRRLFDLGLVEEVEGALRLHRLVAAFVRGVAHDAEAQGAVEYVMLGTANRLNDAGDPRPLLQLQPHLRFITDAAVQHHNQLAAALCNTLAFHLQMIGDYAGARPYFERALAIHERVLGAEHPDTAVSLNNLGYLLQAQGNLQAARPYFERALVIKEAVLGPQHPDTATSLNNLGVLLRAQGDFVAARPYFERALAIREAVLGQDHPDTAASLNNLGYLLQAQGNLQAAQPYFERALAIQEIVLGLEHPDTAVSLNNLGTLLDAMGDYGGARLYYERALAINEAVLGTEHPTTATSLNNLGGLLHAQGNLAGARPYYERALAINEAMLGLDHPDTAVSLNNLGYLLHAQGDLAGAQHYFERALAIWELVLGVDHPGTAASLNNLGGLLHAQGNLAGARHYFERALAIQEATLGAEHPETATSLNNLGVLSRTQGDLTGARHYYERTLTIREAVLGLDHPDTATSLNNLGGLLQAQGDLAAAYPYFERALAVRERVLGPDHQDTAQSLWWMGTLLAQAGDKDGARAYIHRAAAAYVQTLGETHPKTQQCLRHLASLSVAPKSVEERVAAIEQQAHTAVQQALLQGDSEQRVALAARIIDVVRQIEAGEAESAAYLALAARLRLLVEQLHAAG